jgi:hypothetical protein
MGLASMPTATTQRPFTVPTRRSAARRAYLGSLVHGFRGGCHGTFGVPSEFVDALPRQVVPGDAARIVGPFGYALALPERRERAIPAHVSHVLLVWDPAAVGGRVSKSVVRPVEFQPLLPSVGERPIAERGVVVAPLFGNHYPPTAVVAVAQIAWVVAAALHTRPSGIQGSGSATVREGWHRDIIQRRWHFKVAAGIAYINNSEGRR